MVKKFFINLLPGFLVRSFAKPYVSGNSIQKGVDKADDLWEERQITSTLDLLGEEVETKEEVKSNIAIYKELIDKLEGKEHTTISLKPTSLGIHESFEYCENSMREILEHAQKASIPVTIDMEDHNYTDITLDLYHNLIPDFPTLGTVLQSRLYRTKEDIENLPDNSRIRICIGIYDEPEDIALQDKPKMKEKLIEYAQLLIENDHYTEVATHDKDVLNTILEMAEENEWTSDQIEFQQLLGVPRKEIQGKIINKGYTVRLYVPFATDWGTATPYLRRRLNNNPKMAIYVIRQLFSRSMGK